MLRSLVGSEMCIRDRYCLGSASSLLIPFSSRPEFPHSGDCWRSPPSYFCSYLVAVAGSSHPLNSRDSRHRTVPVSNCVLRHTRAHTDTRTQFYCSFLLGRLSVLLLPMISPFHVPSSPSPLSYTLCRCNLRRTLPENAPNFAAHNLLRIYSWISD